MEGYSFNVSITLENNTSKEQTVSIPRGTIIEPESTHLSYQSAIISRDYIFKLNPYEIRSVILDAECWNRQLSPPKQVSGKLTTLKGDIKKTTRIWDTSSKPIKGTIHVNPSQDAHIFSALVNTSPDIAMDFLKFGISESEINESKLDMIITEIDNISSLKSQTEKNKLIQIARDESVHKSIKARELRKFFIKHRGDFEQDSNTLQKLIANVYGLTSHKLAQRLYELSNEVTELMNDRKFEPEDNKKAELLKIAQNKYLTILDSLPILDEIEWTE